MTGQRGKCFLQAGHKMRPQIPDQHFVWQLIPGSEQSAARLSRFLRLRIWSKLPIVLDIFFLHPARPNEAPFESISE